MPFFGSKRLAARGSRNSASLTCDSEDDKICTPDNDASTTTSSQGDSADGGKAQKSSSWTSPPPPPENLTAESVYEFYKQNLLPAIWASLPLLVGRVGNDIRSFFRIGYDKTIHFLLPWTREDFEWSPPAVVPSLANLWNQTSNSSLVEFLLKNFDTNEDGHISASELLRLEEYHLPNFPQHPTRPQTWISWFSSAWPMMDWKLGVFLWRTCGGLLLVVIIASIVPGRLHRISGRLLRWPILFLTYFMIGVELAVYTIIRVFIRIVEAVFASPKHRDLRRRMARAKSYKEWYKLARELDKSQKRDKWQRVINDDTSYRYNWAFIRELINDMRIARETNDSLMALAVLQQCTRKNVGGIMSEDMFSYTNTGEPKHIVREFLEEVSKTLRWVTEEARKIPLPKPPQEVSEEELKSSTELNVKEKAAYESNLHRKISEEKKKVRICTNRNKAFSAHNLFQLLLKAVQEVWEEIMNAARNSWIIPFHDSLFDWASLRALSLNKGESKKELKRHNTASSERSEYSTLSYQTSTIQEESSTEESSSNEELPPEITTTPKEEASPGLPAAHREIVKAFLKRARAAYGRTALCLSGGAMMGNYHFGHVKALFEEDLLPHIISGTSAGSVVAAVICTRTDEEIRRDFCPEALADKLCCFSRAWPDRIRSVYRHGYMFDKQEWMDMIKWFTCGDLTFEEAYRKTGRIFCITLSATTKKAPPVLLNYISAPQVTIASAIVASAAVPGFIEPVLLQIKDADGVVRNQGANKDQTYWDGSIEQDIPTSGLAEMFNCQFFLAAQCNPHIVPFFYNSKGDVGRPSRWSRGMRENSWRGGFLLSALEIYLKADMRAKFVFLDDLEAAVGFTTSLFTQSTYSGTTTIVPQVAFQDYFKLFSNPTLKDLYRYFQGGTVAAYQHCAMMRLHYKVANVLEECLASLEQDEASIGKPKKRRSQLALEKELEEKRQREVEKYAFGPSVLKSHGVTADARSRTDSCSTSLSVEDEEEFLREGFDGNGCPVVPMSF